MQMHIDVIARKYPNIFEVFGPDIRRQICTAQVFGTALNQDESIPLERIREVASAQLEQVCSHFKC